MCFLAKNKPLTAFFLISIISMNLSSCGKDVPSGGRLPAQDIHIPATMGNTNPYGFWFWSDGTTLWIVRDDVGDDKIYAYMLATGARNSAKDINTLGAAGNTSPRGLWSDGTTLWVSDWSDDKIYAYTLAAGERNAAKDINTLRNAGNTSPRGLWSDGTNLWVSDWSDDKIYAYTLATGERNAAKDINTLDSDNDNPLGLWSDGTTLWVANNDFSGSNDKIYAYTLATGARNTAKDINTLNTADNNSPEGLWSDGTTLWVSNNRFDNNKIYAYQLK